MDLTGWMVLWVVVTAAAVVLAYFRMTLGLHDEMGIRLASPDQASFNQRQQAVQRRMNRVDLFGISFTVISAVLAIVVLLVWAMETAAKR